MLFCIRLTNFIQMRPLTVEIWRVTTYLDSWLRYNYFRFLKRSPYRNSTSGFDFDHITVMCMLFCTRLPNFVQLGAHTAEIWRHVDFSKWRPRPLNTTSAFVFVDVTAYRMSKSISKPNVVDISQLTAEIELLSYSKNQTSAIFEFYFRFRFRLQYRNWHDILHHAAEYHLDRTTHSGNMTSYLFLKMADGTAKYYFRFRICWCHCLQKGKVYQQTKSGRHISIDGWDITTSVFEIKRPPYWNSLPVSI